MAEFEPNADDLSTLSDGLERNVRARDEHGTPKWLLCGMACPIHNTQGHMGLGGQHINDSTRNIRGHSRTATGPIVGTENQTETSGATL